MQSATLSDNSSSYAYDGELKRMCKAIGGVTTSLVCAIASLPVVLTDGTRKYVYGLGAGLLRR